jgi:outer membrane protein assembly factor BamB
MNSPICVNNIRVPNRKQTFSFGIAGLLLAIAPLWLMLVTTNTSQAQTTPSPADWTEFHRDNMQRWNPYETTLGVHNVGSLRLLWRYYTGESSLPTSDVGSSPAVVDGVAYLGGSDGKVYALKPETFALLWSYSVDGNPCSICSTQGREVFSSPAVANGVVYFGSGDGNVYALSAGTGAKLWNYTTGGPIDSSPTVVNGVVYIGSDDNNLYALNASTGAKLWSYAGQYGLFSSPAVSNGVVYFGSYGDSNIYALNASTGAKLWSYSVGTNGESSPAVANGVVYIGSADGVVALNAATGAVLWSYNTAAGPVSSSPAVANGVVYVGATNFQFGGTDGAVYALNASTGALLWSYATGTAVYSSPAVGNGVVYIGGDSPNVGVLYALNATTGTMLWSSTLGFQGFSSPVIVDGVVYVHAKDFDGGNLCVFGLPAADTADLYLRIQPTPTTVHQGDLLTYAFPVWNLGPGNADQEVLTTQVPEGTTFDYIRISGTPGLGTCTHPAYQKTGPITCHENSAMAPNTTWTVRLTVKVTAPTGTVITENAAVTEESSDPNEANNAASVSTTVQ